MNASYNFPIPDDLEDIKKFVNYISVTKFSHPLVDFVCKEIGIDITQIYPKRFEEIADKNTNKDINELRYSHLEARRKAKINIISEYLHENKQLQRSNKKITPSHGRANQSPEWQSSQENEADRKARIIKSKIVNQMIVEENQKKLKHDKEEEKKITEKKIKEKETREASKTVNTKIFEIRDKRIKERLDKKKKELEDHEQKALNLFQKPKIQKASYTSVTPTHRHIEVFPNHSASDADIETRLETIHARLQKSAVRAKKLLIQKVNSSHLANTQMEKVKTLREQLVHKEEKEYAKKIVQIQQELEDSSKRRADMMTEQKKLSKSVNREKKLKEDSTWHDKLVKEYEEKDIIIEKARKEVKEIKEQKASYLGMKIELRKKDQEENLKRIQMRKMKDKNKLLDRIKDGDKLNKPKPDLDLSSIRTEARIEAKNRMGIKKDEAK